MLESQQSRKQMHLPSTASLAATAAAPTAPSTVAGVVPTVAALVALVLWVECPATGTVSTATGSAPAAARPATTPIGQLHARATTTYGTSVQGTDCVLRVPGILELDKGETWRVAGHPDAPQVTIVAEGVLQLLLAGVVAQLTHIDLGIARMTRHLRLERKHEMIREFSGRQIRLANIYFGRHFWVSEFLAIKRKIP